MKIIIEHTTNVTARLIQFWMAVDAIRYKKLPKFTYNHALIKTDASVYEAVGKGVVNTTWEKHLMSHSITKYKEYDVELTEDELKIVLDYLEEQKGKPYEYANFWWHIVKTITGKWKGAKNDKKAYCYELLLNALNKLDKYNFDPYMNPRECKIVFDEQFKAIVVND